MPATLVFAGIKWADRIFCVGQTEDSLGQWYVDHQATGEETAVEPEHLWRILLEAHQAGEVLNAGTGDINRDGSAVDTNAVNGMAEQHEYSITKVCGEQALCPVDYHLCVQAGLLLVSLSVAYCLDQSGVHWRRCCQLTGSHLSMQPEP